jgi:hypothetical protein
MRTLSGVFLRPSLVVVVAVAACVAGLPTAVGANSGGQRLSTAPPPPPVDFNSIAPGEVRLIAVLPRGSSTWVTPGVGAGSAWSSPRPGFVRGPSAAPATSSASSGAIAAAPDTADQVSGCAVTIHIPGWSGNALQGSVYWYNCVAVDETLDSVGMQRLGANASYWRDNVHFGNASWTAWSGKNLNCQFLNRQWRTVDSASVESIYGDIAYFAGSSAYAYRYC